MPSRIRRAAGRWGPWVIGSLLSLQLFYTDYRHSDHGWLDGKAFWGRDFVILWGGGDFVRSGGAASIYDVEAFRAHIAGLFGPLSPHNYLYPPVSFPIAGLFSMLPYWAGLLLWLAGTGALFVWAARSWWPREWHSPWLALLTPAALVNIWAGHYGFLVGALFLMGWQRLSERRQLAAGGWFGLMLIKPHLAVLVPIVLLARRQWQAIIAGAATGGVLMIATVLAYGIEPWRDWFVQGGGKWTLLDAGGSFYGYMSTSTATAVLRLSHDMAVALAAQAVLAVAAIAGLVVAALRRTPLSDLAMLTATATFLVLPYAFNYDLMVVTVAALRLWAAPESTRSHRAAAILGFIAPQIGMLVAPLGWPLTPAMLAALFAGQLDLALRRSSAGPAEPATAAGAR